MEKNLLDFHPRRSNSFWLMRGLAAIALDIFHSGRFPPTRTTPPRSNDNPNLFNWLKERQVESITIRDFWKYLKLLFTSDKFDKEEVKEAWNQIKANILVGQPVLIGLQRAKAEAWYKVYQVARFVENHQVVVWGFKETQDLVTLYLYDPSNPQIRAELSFDLLSGSILNCSPIDLGPIFAFFKTGYTYKTPPQEVKPFLKEKST